MRVLIMLLMSLLASGCGSPRNEFEFCSLDRGKFDTESTVIDLSHSVVYGSDVSYRPIEIVRTQFAAGFVKPFPLVLPTVPLAQLPDRWELAGFEFMVAGPRTEGSDWVLIIAQRSGTSMGDAPTRSSVLYSPSKGVMGIQTTVGTLDHRIAADAVSCGTGWLRASSFQ